MENVFKHSVLKLTLDNIGECIFYEDRNGKMLYCNKSYIENFMNTGEEYKEYNAIKSKEVIENSKALKYSQKIINTNGEIKYFEVTKIPITNDGQNVNAILNIMKDKSYKYELEKLRNGFFSNIKHEFRTPLNMIFSSIQLLDYKCKICKIGNCKDCFINNLQLINTNSLRILKLSNNFIDLTNIQSGCMDFNPRNHDIVSFVESICDSINNYKKFKDISLIFDTNLEEHILRFDTDKIERVILNLISNAIKFNIPKGYVYVSLKIEDKYTKISIRDTGIGICNSKINTIFESFSNVENRFTKVSEGSGVGLALSKALVEIHNGNISVESKVGEGSEFIISLPNIINESEEIDITYYKVDMNSLERIKIELSDIYEQ